MVGIALQGILSEKATGGSPRSLFSNDACQRGYVGDYGVGGEGNAHAPCEYFCRHPPTVREEVEGEQFLKYTQGVSGLEGRLSWWEYAVSCLIADWCN